MGHRDESTDSCDDGTEEESGEDVTGVVSADIHPSEGHHDGEHSGNAPPPPVCEHQSCGDGTDDGCVVAWERKVGRLVDGRWMPVIAS